MAKFLVGQIVRVIPEKFEARWTGCFDQGAEVKITAVEHRPNQEIKTAYVLTDEHGMEQIYCEDEIELIQTVIPVKIQKEEKKVETNAIPKTDIKTLYTVVQGGETIGVYIDREVAREVKAEMGGRAAGAEILQFKPAKTIR